MKLKQSIRSLIQHNLTIVADIHDCCQIWHIWNEGKGLYLVDEVLEDSYSASEAMRCLHVGLLCVQDNAADRPTMPEVVFMLSSETDRPQPKRPIFTFQDSVSDRRPRYDNTCSANEATITLLEGR